MRNSGLPYAWFWGIGALLVIVGILGLVTLSGWEILGAILIVAGALQIVLGFAEKRRGAPRA
jgi:hypothetical protein